jgi:hypothetical protein
VINCLLAITWLFLGLYRLEKNEPVSPLNYFLATLCLFVAYFKLGLGVV